MNKLRPEVAAGQREVEQSYLAPRVAGNVASIGLGVAGRIIPFLNTLIPTTLAVKGLSKISPHIANFFENILSNGHTAEEGLDFIRDKMQGQTGVSKDIGQTHKVFQPSSEMNRQTALQTSMNQFKQKKQPMGEQLSQQVENGYPQFAQGQGQQGMDTDTAILAALDKVLKM